MSQSLRILLRKAELPVFYVSAGQGGIKSGINVDRMKEGEGGTSSSSEF